MKLSIKFLFLTFIAILAGISPASAEITLPNLPLACLPERAAPWKDGKSEAQQEACHCPPTSMCPKTYEEYKNNDTAQIPMDFVQRCCPEIVNPRPTCPDGSPMPSSGECPVAVGCPAKFYPSLEQSNMASGGTFTSKYYAQNFTVLNGAWNGAWKLAESYGVSLRTNQTEWIFGPAYCPTWNAIMGTNFPCPADTYKELSGGKNSGVMPVNTLIAALGADKATWFGVSLAEIDKLPDNLASQETINKMNAAGKDIVQVGNYYVLTTGAGEVKNKGPMSDDFGIRANHPAFIGMCDKVRGEYVMLHRETIGGQTCSYLQCRYVHASGGAESCLSGTAQVTLADGTKKTASELAVGDKVRTADGAGKVVATNRYQSGLRVLYGINGSEALLTGDHPLHTKAGWKVITDEAASLYADKPGFAKTALAVGDILITEKGEEKVESIGRFAKVEPASTYNIKVDGGQGFYAEGFEVKGFDRMEMQYK